MTNKFDINPIHPLKRGAQIQKGEYWDGSTTTISKFQEDDMVWNTVAEVTCERCGTSLPLREMEKVICPQCGGLFNPEKYAQMAKRSGSGGGGRK